MPLTDDEKLTAIRAYYQGDFSLQEFFSVAGMTDFKNREFGFQMSGGFIRNRSFESPSQLLHFIQQMSPLGVYAGSIYETPPTAENTIQNIYWVSRELIFDIDLTDYDEVRRCDCKGTKNICELCWDLLRCVAEILLRLLDKAFGFKEIQLVFSGGRGIHLWIRDPLATQLTANQRKAIIDYISLIKGKQILWRSSTEIRGKISKTFRDTWIEIVLSSVLHRKFITRKELQEYGFSPAGAKHIYENREQILQEAYNTSSQEKSVLRLARLLTHKRGRRKNFDEILRNIIWFNYPRFDATVTTDLHRIIRMPGSVHYGTGRLCQIIPDNNFAEFNPFTSRNLYSAVSFQNKL